MIGQIYKKNKKINRHNKAVLFIIAAYLILLTMISSIACFFAYKQKQSELFSEMNITLTHIINEYTNITDNFWQIYMPLFESGNTAYNIFRNYFVSGHTDDLTPLQRRDLLYVLGQMSIRDNNILWIAVYSDVRDTNYIYITENNQLVPLEPDFPYNKELENKNSQMEVYGLKDFAISGQSYKNFAICGGVPDRMGPGKVLVGYSINELEGMHLYSGNTPETLNYYIATDNNIVFSTNNDYKSGLAYIPSSTGSWIYSNDIGRKMYIRVAGQTPRQSFIYYTVTWNELFGLSFSIAYTIIILYAIFVLLSVIIYFFILNLIAKEVYTIRDGLNRIGQNNLEYRISTKFRQQGLEEIADSINTMAESLHNNINRAYYYQLKQRDAELAELQAKFNPHFLYNSLEIFQARCYQNNDPETANLIAQLVSIFRGFVGSKTFIPLQEELAFNNKYLALYRARYGDKVQILYDIEPEVLQYGIIRNALQPIIENYFLHGLDTANNSNYLLFKGRIRDEETIAITVEDNGIGMSEEKIEQINNQLHAPITLEGESYGFKNIHQRLKLFYGSDCGLTVFSNNKKGISVEMIIKRLKYTEQEQQSN